MNIPNANVISQSFAENLIELSFQKRLEINYLKEKHQIIIEDSEGWLAKIYLPWQLNFQNGKNFELKDDFHSALVLIRAGQAVTGYFHQSILLDHKVFRAYMVRQKQGKSQIKYLKTKGKSRAGSRVRLGETVQFFEDINTRLNEYSSNFPIDLWGISCAKTLWPFYFESEIQPPFSQNQENLIAVPFHIAQASFDELKQAGNLMSKFHLLYSEKGKMHFSSLETTSQSSEFESENW
jgi:hypothetical protein